MFTRLIDLIFTKKQQSIILRLWEISSKHKFFALCAFISLMITSCIHVIFPYNIGKITSVFTDEESLLKLSNNISAIFGYVVLYQVIKITSNVCIDMFTMAFIRELRETYFNSLMQKDIEFFDGKTSSDLFSLLTGEIENLRNTSIIELASVIKQILETCGALFGMFYVSFKLSCLLMVLIPIVGIIFNFSNGKRRKKMHNIHSHKKASHNIALESLQNIRIVKAFSTEEKEAKKYSKKLNEMAEIEYNAVIQTSLFDLVIGILFIGGVLLIIRIGIYLLQGENITVANLTSFILYCYMLFNSFMSFSKMSRRVMKSLYIAEKLFNVIDYVPKIKSDHQGTKIKLQGEIKLNNISFDYPSKKDTTVLKNFSLCINKHESVGIVGSSGSGKTTLINLIERLYEVNSSTNPSDCITYDNIDIRQLDLKDLHRQIGYVCQEPALFKGTILDNVVYGVDKYTDEDVKTALKRAKAEFVYDKEIFPNGLDTDVGERGIQLSGGQKQRIAIARALIKNPSILILDEATSALDSESEFQFQKEMDELKGSLTIIIIAHRLSTIKNCDKIVVLDHGVIVESGKHEELLALNGTYKRLMERQIGFFE